jgi:hypothetical protein
MESKTPIIKFVYMDVDAALNTYEGVPDPEVPIRVRELRWIIDHADEYGYKREGNSWIWEPNP